MVHPRRRLRPILPSRELFAGSPSPSDLLVAVPVFSVRPRGPAGGAESLQDALDADQVLMCVSLRRLTHHRAERETERERAGGAFQRKLFLRTEELIAQFKAEMCSPHAYLRSGLTFSKR